MARKKNLSHAKLHLVSWDGILALAWLLVKGHVHMDSASTESENLKTSLEMADLTQHIMEPTHSKEHTLDLLITRNDDEFVKDIKVSPSLPSDQYTVSYKLAIQKPPPMKNRGIQENQVHQY